MTKALFLDVDGTLSTYAGIVLPSTIKAINMAHKKGHLIFACTSRIKDDVYNQLKDFPIDGYICANGAYLELNNEVLLHCHISKEKVTNISKWCLENNIPYYLKTDSGYYASELFLDKLPSFIKKYRKRVTSDRLTGKLKLIKQSKLNDVNKVILLLENHKRLIKKNYPDIIFNIWDENAKNPMFGDISVEKVSKLTGIEFILKKLDLTFEDAIAFGDGRIDIPMIKACGIGVAMAQGNKELKEVADFITKSIDDNGLYYAFKKLDLL